MHRTETTRWRESHKIGAGNPVGERGTRLNELLAMYC